MTPASTGVGLIEDDKLILLKYGFVDKFIICGLLNAIILA